RRRAKLDGDHIKTDVPVPVDVVNKLFGSVKDVVGFRLGDKTLRFTEVVRGTGFYLDKKQPVVAAGDDVDFGFPEAIVSGHDFVSFAGEVLRGQILALHAGFDGVAHTKSDYL